MPDNRPKLPRARLRDEKLYIEGEKEPYFRDRTNEVRLRIDALTVRRGYQDRTGSKVLTETLHGIATLEEDEFAVIGLETDDTTPIKFLLAPIPETDTEYHWHATIGFLRPDGEFRRDAHFWISGYCTSQYFDDLLAAVRRGHIDKIRVGMETTMWTKDPPLMSGSPRTWHFAPPATAAPTITAMETKVAKNVMRRDRLMESPGGRHTVTGAFLCSAITSLAGS
jgi:hypothetical protein